jgi:hypothetical protein
MRQLSGGINKRGALLLAAGLILLAIVYYWLVWGSVNELVHALDHCQQLFCDFTRQYHPTGNALLTTGQPSNGYYYSSFFALWLVPFGRLAVETALPLWGLFQVATLLLLFLPGKALLDESPWAFVLYIALLAFSMPLLHNLKWGQLSVLITGCALATLLLYQRNRPLAAAVLLALATAIKYYTGLFALYFLFKRQWRFLAIYGLMTAVFWLVIPTLLLGFEANWNFYQTVSQRIAHGMTTWILEDINAQYLASVVTRVFALPEGYRPLLRLVGYAVFGANVWLLFRLCRANHPAEIEWAFALLFLSLPFLAETAWPHYFVYLPFCQTLAFLALRAEQPGGRRTAGSLLLLSSIVLASMPFFQWVGRWQDYNRLGMLFLSNLLLLLLTYRIWLKPYWKEESRLENTSLKPRPHINQ